MPDYDFFTPTASLEQIHQAALRILDEIGVEMDHDQMRERLAGQGCRVADARATGDRVTFPPELVAATLAAIPSRFRLYGRTPEISAVVDADGPMLCTNTGILPDVYDLDTGSLRRATLVDVAATTRILDALPNVDIVYVSLPEVGDMVDEGDRLIRLVNDLLVLARADAGRNLAKEPLEIFPVLDETCQQARQLEPQRKIILKSAPDLAILGDRDALKQVLLIALDNALKHSAGDIAVTAGFKGTNVEIRVHDSGEGISPEKLEHIFDRFYRGEDTSTIPGFGLGLPIARALVEGQGGTIMMESEIGKGSLLIFDFPRAPESI